MAHWNNVDHLPPMMGLEDEMIIAPTSVIDHYTAVLNGMRVYVWGDDVKWWAEACGIKDKFTDSGRISIEVPSGDALLLRAALEKLTSGGNDV